MSKKSGKGGLSPSTSSMGISSQDNGANTLAGTYAARPMPGFINQNKSVQVDNRLGTKSEGDALGPLQGRK
jgi:hypothetical protein